jgi:hypothetical protein
LWTKYLTNNAFGSTFSFLPIAQNQTKNEKELPSQRTNKRTDKQDEKEGRRHNITYTQAGGSCFVGQVNGKFKVQFFVGSLVVKIPACV